MLRDAAWLPRARFPVPSLVPGWHVFAIELASGGCCQVDGGGTGSGPNPAHSSAGGGGTASNVTSTLASLRSATVHEDPLHAPEKPDSRQPESGVAVRTIVAPSSNVALHALPQSIPAGLDVTVPEPVFTTVRTCLPGGGAFANVAATERSASSTTLHSPDPWQSPLHPPNTLAPSGTATSVSWVPAATFVVQGALQSARPVAWIFPPPVPWTTRVSTCVEGPTSPEGELGIVDPHAAHRLHAAVASTSERIGISPCRNLITSSDRRKGLPMTERESGSCRGESERAAPEFALIGRRCRTRPRSDRLEIGAGRKSGAPNRTRTCGLRFRGRGRSRIRLVLATRALLRMPRALAKSRAARSAERPRTRNSRDGRAGPSAQRLLQLGDVVLPERSLGGRREASRSGGRAGGGQAEMPEDS